jgi:predicted metal-dependent hydrolase
MATKTLTLPEIGSITIYKRRGARSIRLSIRENTVRVTLPYWLPYKAGIEFAKQHEAWISKHRIIPELLSGGQSIGKKHHLRFQRSQTAQKVTSRIKDQLITVQLPEQVTPSSHQAQTIASRAAVRALKQEAEELLPRRLRALAEAHEFTFKSVEVKRLKSRWGSCNHKKEIVLNCFLMQLPWELIDYVLMHELVHTRILAHGPKFWGELRGYVPDLAQIRKEIRSHRPLLKGVINTSSMQ